VRTKTITQTITFKASPRQVYDMIMVSKKHQSLSGEKAKISQRVGGKFTAWGAASYVDHIDEVGSVEHETIHESICSLLVSETSRLSTCLDFQAREYRWPGKHSRNLPVFLVGLPNTTGRSASFCAAQPKPDSCAGRSGDTHLV
jgi:hypothetical protein